MSAAKRPALLLLAILAIACGSTLPAGGSGTPLSLPELKYRVIDKVGAPYVCGPPVAFHDYDQQQAAAQFPAIKADTQTYQAILVHAHPASDETSPAYQVAVWQEWRKLEATRLTANSSGGYDFVVRTATATASGSVDSGGNVTVASTQPGRPNCPICLPATALIDAPAGPVRVTDLRLGDVIWTARPDGSRLGAIVLAVGSVPFPLGHDAIQVELSDGRSVTASAGHPTADGRTLGSLRAGDQLDGATIVAALTVHLTDGATYDLLPSGPTGRYWADGVLLGSTLRLTTGFGE